MQILLFVFLGVFLLAIQLFSVNVSDPVSNLNYLETNANISAQNLFLYTSLAKDAEIIESGNVVSRDIPDSEIQEKLRDGRISKLTSFTKMGDYHSFAYVGNAPNGNGEFTKYLVVTWENFTKSGVVPKYVAEYLVNLLTINLHYDEQTSWEVPVIAYLKDAKSSNCEYLDNNILNNFTTPVRLQIERYRSLLHQVCDYGKNNLGKDMLGDYILVEPIIQNQKH